MVGGEAHRKQYINLNQKRFCPPRKQAVAPAYKSLGPRAQAHVAAKANIGSFFKAVFEKSVVYLLICICMKVLGTGKWGRNVFVFPPNVFTNLFKISAKFFSHHSWRL